MRSAVLALYVSILALALGSGCAGEDRLGVRDMPDATDETPATATALATFGGGCFWCTEAVLEELDGVTDVVSGYAGGEWDDPTYDEICSGTTGHAEVVQVTYDPARVSYEDLLRVFFGTHDPTTLDRQGADRGTQYRSIVLVHDDEQGAVAKKLKAELDASGTFADPIVTEIVTLERFYAAEDEHQDYFRRNPEKGYCRVIIRPKVDSLRKLLNDRQR